MVIFGRKQRTQESIGRPSLLWNCYSLWVCSLCWPHMRFFGKILVSEGEPNAICARAKHLLVDFTLDLPTSEGSDLPRPACRKPDNDSRPRGSLVPRNCCVVHRVVVRFPARPRVRFKAHSIVPQNINGRRAKRKKETRQWAPMPAWPRWGATTRCWAVGLNLDRVTTPQSLLGPTSSLAPPSELWQNWSPPIGGVKGDTECAVARQWYTELNARRPVMLRATPVMVFWTLVSSCRSHSSAATGLRDCSSGMGEHQCSPLSGFGAVSYSSSDEETSGSVSGSSTSSSAPASPGAVVFRQHRSAGMRIMCRLYAASGIGFSCLAWCSYSPIRSQDLGRYSVLESDAVGVATAFVRIFSIIGLMYNEILPGGRLLGMVRCVWVLCFGSVTGILLGYDWCHCQSGLRWRAPGFLRAQLVLCWDTGWYALGVRLLFCFLFDICFGPF